MNVKMEEQERKSMKQSWFFEKVNKINSSPAKRMAWGEIFTNIRNEMGNITTDPTDIKKMTREYYEQLHRHKFDSIPAVY